MSKFKDKMNREWELELVHPDIKRLRQIGLDLNIAVSDPTKLSPLDDPEKCVDIIWTLCSKQAQAAGIDRDSFESAIDGPTRARAVHAFQEAFADFGYWPPVAEALKRKLTADAEKMAAELNGTMIPSGSKSSDTSSPGSPESIPPG